MADSPIYAPLDAASPSTRLLTIEPSVGAEDNKLSCSLAPVRLDEWPPFVALSYVWGDTNVGSETITVNGRPKSIGANLATALRFFRGNGGQTSSPELPRHIWVDALCINQDDTAEKSVQVGHMDNIYKSASIILSHLGKGNAEADQGCEAIRALAKAWRCLLTDCNRALTGDEDKRIRPGTVLLDEGKTRETLTELASTLPGNDTWSSVKAFFSLPYWSRTWIIQEIVLGREVMLVLGALEPIAWADLRDAMLITQQIPKILDDFEVYDRSLWDPFEGSVELHWEYVELIRSYKETSGYIQLHGKILLPYAMGVMFRTAQHLASNPRDKVFGLLGICELPVQPKYALPVHHVYAKLGVGCVYFEQFNILLSAGRGLPFTSDPLLPSWVPDWQAISLAKWHSPVSPDSYQASGWIDPFPGPPQTSHMENLERGFLLTLNSFTYDAISSVWHITTLNSPALIDMCRDLLALSPVDPSGAPTLQSLLRAFCLDRPLATDYQRPLLDFTNGDIDEIVPIVLDFLSFILPYSEPDISDTSDSVLEESLSALGIDPGFAFADDLKATFFPANGGSLVTTIDFSTFGDDVLQRAFPGLSLEAARSQPTVRHRGIDMVKRGSDMPVRKQLLARIEKWMGCGYRVFRTEKGYVGIGPPGMEVGDGVHVVRRCAAPIVVRRGEEMEEITVDGDKRSLGVGRLVGACCLVGSMHNELGVKDDSEVAGFAEGDEGEENEEGNGMLKEYIRKVFPDIILVR